MKALEAELLARHGVQDVKDLPVNLAGVALQAGEEYGDRVYDHHYAELRSVHREQAELRLGRAVFSPRLALRPLSASLCGTDVATHEAFTTAAEAHRRALVRRLNDDIVQRPGAEPFAFKAGPELWREVDELTWTPPEAPPPDLRGRVALAGLVGLSLALAAAATRRLAIDP